MKCSRVEFLTKFISKLINHKTTLAWTWGTVIIKRNNLETPLEHKSSPNFGAHTEFYSLPEVGYEFLVTKGHILLITPINSDNLPAYAVQGVPGWTRVACCTKKPHYHSCFRALYFHLFSHNGHQSSFATTCQELKVLELHVSRLKLNSGKLNSRVPCWI